MEGGVGDVITVTAGEDLPEVFEEEEESVGIMTIFLAGAFVKDTVDTRRDWLTFGNEMVGPCEEGVTGLLVVLGGVVLVLGGGEPFVLGGGVPFELGGGVAFVLGVGVSLVGDGVSVLAGGGAPPGDPITLFATQRTCYRRLSGRLNILGLTPEAGVHIKAQIYDMIGKKKSTTNLSTVNFAFVSNLFVVRTQSVLAHPILFSNFFTCITGLDSLSVPAVMVDITKADCLPRREVVAIFDSKITVDLSKLGATIAKPKNVNNT